MLRTVFSPELSRKVFDASADSLLFIDHSGKILDANESARGVFLTASKNCSGMAMQAILNFSLERIPLDPFALPHLPGKSFTARILRDVEPGIHLLTLKEISVQKINFEKITQHLPHMVWTADLAGKIEFANAACLNYTGFSTTEEFSRSWSSRIHSDDFKQVSQSWLSSMQTGIDFSEEYRILSREGNYRWFIGRAAAIRNQASEILYWAGCATDIEEQKQAIENLKTEKVLREQFVNMLTHDLRNPFSAAKITAQLLTRQNHSPEKIKNLTSRIIGSLNRANQMIDNLLDANRIKAGVPLMLEMEDISFVPLIQESIQELKTLHGDRFQLVCTEAELKGTGNPDAIKRIVENLCSNAAKHGDEKSPVTIELSKQDEFISLSVHNLGNPIAGDDLDHLFDSHRRPTPSDNKKLKGWGLGLILARGLLRAHGGTLKAKSSKAEGTTFSAKLLCDAGQFVESSSNV